MTNPLRTMAGRVWVGMVCCVALAAMARGQSEPAGAGASSEAALYHRVAPSLVAVQFTWESEAGRRELIGAGVVVGEDGLVMTTIALTDTRIPDGQMKDFKIIVPKADADNQEVEAEFVGRDERNNVSFVKPRESLKLPAVKFAEGPVNVGDVVYSVGLLPKAAGYRAYVTRARVSALLRGEIKQVLVDGALTTPGSPVFDERGTAVGFVDAASAEASVFLNDFNLGGRGRLGGESFGTPLIAVLQPPKLFVPTREFVQSLQDPPVAGKPLELPWTGVAQLTGLSKDVAEFYGLGGKTAIQIGDVVADSPAAKAGLKRGMIITKLDGKPIPRGDEPDELPEIFRRMIYRTKIGTTITLTVLSGKDQPAKDVKVTLEQQPKRPTAAKRYFAEDLGFAVRELVFSDTYQRKLPADTKGVVVAYIRPSSSAASAHLQTNDLITEFNGKPVTGLDEFKDALGAFRKEKPGEALVLVVTREGNTQIIRIEPPQ